MNHRERVVSKEELLDAVWGESHESQCSSGAQNSYSEFLAAVGARHEDAEAPQIELEASAREALWGWKPTAA